MPKSTSTSTHPLARLLGLIVGLALASAPAQGAASTFPAFKLLIEHAGVYRVSFEELSQAGLPQPVPVAGLGLEVGGRAVPVWVEAGGDGELGPGDELEFVGERLAGDYSYSSEHTRYNVYSLRFDHAGPARMRSRPASDRGEGPGPTLLSETHFEDEVMILRLPPARDDQPDELWYWAKLVFGDKDPFTFPLPLEDMVAGGSLDLRLQLRGWSKPREKPEGAADHAIEVELAGETIAAATWDGTDPYLIEIPAVPVAPGTAEAPLVLKVPRRVANEQGQPLVDVVMLNWIESTFTRGPRVGVEGASFRLDGPATGAEALALETDPGRSLVLYGDSGSRSVSPAAGEGAGPQLHYFELPSGETVFAAVPPSGRRTVVAVVPDRPSDLRNLQNRADYVMIAHPRLLEATQPLADLHRRRGLEVLVVDVEDVYDEFNHGVVHPRAIRDFLSFAYHKWQAPALRYVLLVGDASWDGRNETADDANYADWTYRPGERAWFGKNDSTPYAEEADTNRRGLIPTWNHSTYEGHSASDNHFVAIDGDDDFPDLAIGRFPVVDPEEVDRIVAKTRAYTESPEVGPWRRNALFITNESPSFQRRSDQLAAGLAVSGYAADKVYPASTETSNEHHTQKLIDTFDEGQLVVHFLGHGGRYIWRTGPPDLEKNHDLFTLEHLEQLTETTRLPVVISLTCYSAPFDHPTADSIGEKLLRIGNRGAIAVFAASWRNSPSPTWGQVVLDELTTPGRTIGEAVMEAKRQIRNRMFVETYNLLGDPAVPVAQPSGRIDLQVSRGEEETVAWQVQGSLLGDPFAGSVMVDLVGEDGETLQSLTTETDGLGFTVRFLEGTPGEGAARFVRAYAWNSERGVDAAGGVEIAQDDPAPTSTRR